jgi:hypothetical protein
LVLLWRNPPTPVENNHQVIADIYQICYNLQPLAIAEASRQWAIAIGFTMSVTRVLLGVRA